LARRGAFDEAFTELGTEGMARERAVANIEDLFALADVARLSGHPREAVSPLSEIVRRGGSQASIAALTLGRVRIDQLGEPDLAAQDFERAVELGLDGPLREGALARRVEALARAGQNDRATDAARAFASRYPTSKSRVEKWLPQSE
jgi:transmembrane sensor